MQGSHTVVSSTRSAVFVCLAACQRNPTIRSDHTEWPAKTVAEAVNGRIRSLLVAGYMDALTYVARINVCWSRDVRKERPVGGLNLEARWVAPWHDRHCNDGGNLLEKETSYYELQGILRCRVETFFFFQILMHTRSSCRRSSVVTDDAHDFLKHDFWRGTPWMEVKVQFAEDRDPADYT